MWNASWRATKSSKTTTREYGFATSDRSFSSAGSSSNTFIGCLQIKRLSPFRSTPVGKNSPFFARGSGRREKAAHHPPRSLGRHSQYRIEPSKWILHLFFTLGVRLPVAVNNQAILVRAWREPQILHPLTRDR